MVSLRRHTRVEFRGYLRFSVTARIWRKSWEVRLTDRPLAAHNSRVQFDVPPKHYRQFAVYQHGKMSTAARLAVFCWLRTTQLAKD